MCKHLLKFVVFTCGLLLCGAFSYGQSTGSNGETAAKAEKAVEPAIKKATPSGDSGVFAFGVKTSLLGVKFGGNVCDAPGVNCSKRGIRPERSKQCRRRAGKNQQEPWRRSRRIRLSLWDSDTRCIDTRSFDFNT